MKIDYGARALEWICVAGRLRVTEPQADKIPEILAHSDSLRFEIPR